MQNFRTVADIRIERGGASKLDAHIEGLCANKRVFIVTDAGVNGLGLLDGAKNALRDAGYSCEVFDQVVADPPESIVLAGAKRAREFGAGLILGFGGGSPMDTAKVIALLAGSDQTLSTMYGVNMAIGPRLPLMLVPTTAGTGSEVTNVAILTTGKTEKQGIVANALYADRVLLDAELTTSIPKLTTAATGIDAMVHAIEAYTSLPQKNPISDALALSALTKLKDSIEHVCLDGKDIDARENMLIGAMLAGQAFSNAPCAAIHALAYPLGGFFHVPHGLSNALVMNGVMDYNLPKADGLYGEISDHLKLGGAGVNLIGEMQRIKDSVGVPQTLRSVDIPGAAIEIMADDAMTKTRLLVNNPREMTLAATIKIYEDILG